MLSKKQLNQIKEELDNCSNPLYFFHDDADGVASFLLFYRYKKEGHGIVIKSNPLIDEKFIKKVEEYNPDKIFILDIAKVDPEFAKKVNVPVVWIDHHEPKHIPNIKYFNPMRDGDNVPVSGICYETVGQELWIGMAGMIGDWYLPPYHDQFYELYPDLFLNNVSTAPEALFETKIGEISKIMSFMLKGTTGDAMKCVKIFTRIKTPYELLNEESSGAKYIMKKYKKLDEEYQKLLKSIKINKSRIIEFTYTIDNTSFTGDIANELLYRYPDRIIIIARKSSGEMKSSIRSCKQLNIRNIVEKALVGVEGYGGGHENACGACIKEEDWKTFIKNIERELGSLKDEKADNSSVQS